MTELDESRVRNIAREEAEQVMSPSDADATMSTFMDLGLTRRDALKALGLVALGYGTSTAAMKAVTGQASADAQGTVGTSTDPLLSVYTEELNGGATGNPITHLEGNVFVQSTSPTAQNTGDLWVDTS